MKNIDNSAQKDAVASDVDAFVMCEDCERPWVCGDANECCRQCLICCGEGTVDGHDYADPLWDYEEYENPFMECPSCGGSGLAKDMQWQ